MLRAVGACLALVVFVLGETACTHSGNVASAPATPLAAVSPLPATQPPPWIISVAPQNQADSRSPIRILFRADVIPLQSLEAPERLAVLSHIRIEPGLPGRFVVLTPRMIGWEADAPLPFATRVRVTLTKGLADLQGHRLDQPYAWTFQTAGISLASNLPNERTKNLKASPLTPEIIISSNTELDPSSLLEHVRLVDTSDLQTTANLIRKTGEDQKPHLSATLIPQIALPTARRYRLEISPGIAPLHGNMPSEQWITGLLETADAQDALVSPVPSIPVAQNTPNTHPTLSAKPLVTKALVPLFARPGDMVRGGVAVTNTQRMEGDARITGTLTGDLVFVNGARSSQTTLLSQPIDQIAQEFRFDMRVTGTHPSTVQFVTKLAGLRDELLEPLDIRTSDVMESVVQVGAMTSDRAIIPLSVDPQTPVAHGELEVTLASTLLPQTREAVRATLADETPLAMEIASRIIVASDAIVLNRQYGRTVENPDLQRTLVDNLNALRRLRAADGGFAPWPGARASEISSTAFCAVSLERARVTGANVVADIKGVRSYLLSHLRDSAEVRLKVLDTLGILGEAHDDHIIDIYAQHKSFSFVEQVELVRVLLALPTWHARGMALQDELLKRFRLTGQPATVPHASLETVTATQAQLVTFLVDAHARPEDIERAFRGLLDLRNNGVWPCPCDSAQALDAVVAYAARQPKPPDFGASAEVAGAVLHAQFRGYENTSVTKKIPLTTALEGNAAIVLSKSAAGTLQYVVGYHYIPLGDQPGVYAGIRLDRLVRRAGDSHEIFAFGLAKPGAMMIDTGHIYEVEDRVTTDHVLDRVVLTDPFPAGFEAVGSDSDSLRSDYQKIYRDHMFAFMQHLEPGIYAIRYSVRSVTPGIFAWPAAQAYSAYAPGELGRTSSGYLSIR